MAGSKVRTGNYGLGKVAIRAVCVDPQSLVTDLLELFRAPGYQPPRMPEIGLRLLEIARDPDVDMRKISELLEQDALLAGEVVTLGQSAAFGRAAGPLTIHQAVTRLGLQRAAELFVVASMNLRVFRAQGYEEPMLRLQRHSLVVAYLAKYIARETPFPEDHAFLCGLLHDVGLAAALIAIAEKATALHTRPMPFSTLGPALKRIDDQASGVVARLWGLPADVVMVLSRHHHPIIDGRAHPLAQIIHLADCLAIQSGFEVLPWEPAVLDPTLRDLQLSSSALDRALTQAWAALEGLGLAPESQGLRR